MALPLNNKTQSVAQIVIDLGASTALDTNNNITVRAGQDALNLHNLSVVSVFCDTPSTRLIKIDLKQPAQVRQKDIYLFSAAGGASGSDLRLQLHSSDQLTLYPAPIPWTENGGTTLKIQDLVLKVTDWNNAAITYNRLVITCQSWLDGVIQQLPITRPSVANAGNQLRVGSLMPDGAV